MNLYEKKNGKLKKLLLISLRLLLPVLFCIFVLHELHQVSGHTSDSARITLEQALRNTAVQVYALEGRYPESLSELLEKYRIPYDRQRFVIEYLPNGSNLFPSISVLPLKAAEGGTT